MAKPNVDDGLAKRVQELAATGEEPPLRYIRNKLGIPTNDVSFPRSPIPVIDVGLLFCESKEREDEMKKLRIALQSWGFFQAVGHGISGSLLDEVRKKARDFFGLPMEEKQKYSKTALDLDGETFFEGYGNDQIVSDDQILDWSDRLYLLVEPQDMRKLKIWPENPSSFRETLHEYTMNASMVINLVLRAIAELLDLEKEYFTEQFGEKAMTYARLNYYPPCSRPDLVLGIKDHSDAGVITLLLQDELVEGLQVVKDGEWVKVPIVPDALLVNIGDQMEIMSNGIFKSPVHRAVTNSRKERISLAMFYSPEPEKEIEPAEGLVGRTGRLYKKVKFKDYLLAFFENFSQGKRSIDSAKI